MESEEAGQGSPPEAQIEADTEMMDVDDDQPRLEIVEDPEDQPATPQTPHVDDVEVEIATEVTEVPEPADDEQVVEPILSEQPEECVPPVEPSEEPVIDSDSSEIVAESDPQPTEVIEPDAVHTPVDTIESVEDMKLKIQDLTEKLQSYETQRLKDRESYESFQQQRDDAINERNTLMSMIGRLNSEISYMKDLHLKTSQQLKTTIESNCEIITKNEQLKIKEISLQYREELMEQEKAILNERIQNLTEDLNSKNIELETMRIDKFSKVSSLEIQLASKTEELNIADNDVKHLRDQRLKLITEIENLNRKLDELRGVDTKICDDLRKKLTAQTKITDLYKSMREDSEAKCEELVNGVNELKKLLNDAVEKYGELESKNVKLEMDHDTILKQKNSLISSLREDLENAKKDLEMKKSERFVSTLKQLSPTASVVREFFKSGMSIVQIYNQLVSVSDELEKKNSENAHLNEVLTTIVKDFEESAPFIKEQLVQNEENHDKNMEITQRLESVELEYNQLKDDYAECLKLNQHFEKENKKLKQGLNDLSEQVCFLLKEIEISGKGNLYGDKDVSTSTTSSEHSSYQIISKNLVTFSDIQELQTNNQKLLKIIRDLCDKQEEIEELKDQIDSGEYQTKLEMLTDKVNDLSSTNERHTKTISSLIHQRNMYKKLYHSKKGSTQSLEFMDDDDDEAAIDERLNETDKNETLKSKNGKSADEIKILEQQLDETKKQLEQEKQSRKVYEHLSDSKEKLLLTKVDKLEKEVFDLNEKYRKCHCSAEASNEKNKILQANLISCKKMISNMESSVERCNIKISESESTTKFLQEKISNYETKLAQNDTSVGNLQKECKMLRELKNKLLNEKDKLSEELHNQSALIANFEVIKNMIEKKQIVDKSNLENKLEEFTRECSLLRRKLQDREDGVDRTDSADGSSDYEKAKLEVMMLREEVNIKTKSIEDLKSVLSSGEYGQLKEQIKSLNIELAEKITEIESLSQQLTNNKEYMKQFTCISEHAEEELKAINDKFSEYRKESELKLSQYEVSVEQLKEKCSELEAELSLQSTNHGELNSEISNAEETIKSLTQQLFEKTGSLDSLHTEVIKLNDQIKSLEDQNSYFTVSNSEIVQQKNALQSKVIELNQTITSLTCEKVQYEDKINECKLTCENNINAILLEKDQLLEQVTELRHQNSLLHDQFESFNTQQILNQSKNLNDSVSSDVDTTLENESKSHLLQIIKYLRKDRDLHGRKFDSMREENLKIRSELDSAQASINEMKKSQTKSNDEFQNSSNSSLHFEMVNQLETLNTISMSNTLLREERDKNLNNIKKLTEKLKELEEKTEILQKNNDDLTKRINSIVTEKNCIQNECSRWKSRTSSLLEKSNKTEDWKRLQNERETLAKMLTSEKDNVRKVREEATLFKLEKNKLEEQVTSLNNQLGNLSEENRKQCEELRSNIAQLSAELNETKSAIQEKTDENVQLNNNLKTSNSIITEARNKEIQLRKIAKLYKTQYETLSKSVEEDKKIAAATSAETSTVSQNSPDTQKELEQKVLDLEKTNSVKTAELEAQVSSSLEENSTLHKEIQILKVKNENTEERAKIAMKQAQTKISQLAESKENLSRELNDVKVKLDTLEQNKNEHDVRLVALKSQYEGRLVKLEKEKNQLQQTQQNEVAQLNKQIEGLTQRIAQMQRQMDVQSAKPSTSSNQVEKSGTEPPTANIKPMAGSQTSVGGRRLGAETPLASIKPMTSVPAVRTAAVLPTTVSSLQTPHTPSPLIGETTSSSPSSSHGTEYLPASSSTANRLHLPHTQSSQQTHASPPESTQDTETDSKSEPVVHANASASAPPLSNASGSQQTVALVSPRMETSNDETVQLTSSNNGSNSTVTTSYSNPIEQSNENMRDNSSVQKRSRTDFTDEKPDSKRAKIQESSECEAEYQVPTSSQKDQEDDSVIVVDSDDEENDYEESNLYMDEEIEDEDEEEDDDDDEEEDDDDDDDEEEDNEEEEEDDDNEMKEEDEEIIEEVVDEGEEEEIAEGEEVEEQNASDAQSEDDIDNENDAAANCDKTDATGVEYVDDASENSDDGKDAAALSSHGESSTMLHSSSEQMLSSNTQNLPRTSFLTLRSASSGINTNAPSGSYEEGDDSIVPSTPTLYVPNRNDGFGEAVRSPVVENVGPDRFSFNASNSQGVMENTHADLTAQLSSRQNQNPNDMPDEASDAVRNLEATFS